MEKRLSFFDLLVKSRWLRHILFTLTQRRLMYSLKVEDDLSLLKKHKRERIKH